MKLTNKNGFPEALVRAMENDKYSKGDSDFSVTELLKPPRQRALQKQFADEIVEDAEDRLYSLYGQIVHLILERANESDLVEERFFAVIDGYRISGQVDSLTLKNGSLTDWKFSTAWAFKQNQEPKPEWVAQMNMQAELLRLNGKEVNSLQIVGLIRDFSKPEAFRNPSYPQSSVVTQPIEMWPREKVMAFIKERIKLHAAAEKELPECTPEERWAKTDMYAVMKKGAKRAVSLHQSRKEAEEVCKHSGSNHTVEVRPGSSPRCEMYCSASEFCTQYNNQIKKVMNE